VQLTGGGQKAFAFNILATANEVLLEHPDDRIRSLKDLEEVQQLRLVIGMPAKTGQNDPDSVGLVDWQLAIYSGKGGVNAALDFIHFVLQKKINKGYLGSLPALQARVMAPAAHQPLPTPWQELSDDSLAMPMPFSALPPKDVAMWSVSWTGKKRMLMLATPSPSSVSSITTNNGLRISVSKVPCSLSVLPTSATMYVT
jgi:hypothetical protein